MDHVDELLNYVREKHRVCPVPQRWHELWELLPERRRVGNGWEPSLPLILAAWWDTPILAKMARLHEHIKYAAENGVLPQVDRFLRELPEDQWAHVEDFSTTSGNHTPDYLPDDDQTPSLPPNSLINTSPEAREGVARLTHAATQGREEFDKEWDRMFHGPSADDNPTPSSRVISDSQTRVGETAVNMQLQDAFHQGGEEAFRKKYDELIPPFEHTGSAPRASREEGERVIGEMMMDLINTPVEPNQGAENLLETIDILRLALLSRDKEKAFEAVTVLLMQFLSAFGTDWVFFQTVFPTLEELKDHIQAQKFDEALAQVLAFQTKFRSVLKVTRTQYE
jgi:hypothetical protein